MAAKTAIAKCGLKKLTECNRDRRYYRKHVRYDPRNHERVPAGASDAVSPFVGERNWECHPVNVERGPCWLSTLS